MAYNVPGPNGGYINRQEKGDSGLPGAGRHKKFTTLLKEAGYTIEDIHDTIKKMLAMDRQEIMEVGRDYDCTILELTIARALMESVRKGNLSAIETLITRSFGKPTEKFIVNQTSEIKERIVLSIDPIEAAKQYKKIMQDG